MIVEFRGQAYYDLFSSFFSRLKGSCGTQKILIKDSVLCSSPDHGHNKAYNKDP